MLGSRPVNFGLIKKLVCKFRWFTTKLDSSTFNVSIKALKLHALMC